MKTVERRIRLDEDRPLTASLDHPEQQREGSILVAKGRVKRLGNLDYFFAGNRNAIACVGMQHRYLKGHGRAPDMPPANFFRNGSGTLPHCERRNRHRL